MHTDSIIGIRRGNMFYTLSFALYADLSMIHKTYRHAHETSDLCRNLHLSAILFNNQTQAP